MPPVTQKVLDTIAQNTNRTTKTSTYNITFEGTVMGLTTYLESGTTRRQTFSRVELQKKDGTLILMLCSGYTDVGDKSVNGYGEIPVDTSMRIVMVGASSVTASLSAILTYSTDYVASRTVWTGKYEKSTDGAPAIRNITGTDPALGANSAEVVPTGAKWELVGWSQVFVTGNTKSGNRRYKLNQKDTVGVLFYKTRSKVTHATAVTNTYIAFSGAENESSVDGNSQASLPLQTEIPSLIQTDTINTSIEGLQAGDNLGAPIMHVKEWLDI